MNTPTQGAIRRSFDFISYDEFIPFMQRVDAMEQELRELKKNQSEYVSQKEAMKITGFASPQAIKAARERPGTLIIVKKSGKNNQIPQYLRSSLIAHNESKVRRPRTPATALHPSH